MKRIITFLLAMSFPFVLASCSSSNKNNTNTSSGNTNNSSTNSIDNPTLSEEEEIRSRVNGLTFNGLNKIFEGKSNSSKKMRHNYHSSLYDEIGFNDTTGNGFHKLSVITSDSEEYSSINPLNALNDIVSSSSSDALNLLANSEQDFYFLPGYYIVNNNYYGDTEKDTTSKYYGHTDDNTLTFIDNYHHKEDKKETDVEKDTIITSNDGNNVLKIYTNNAYTGSLDNKMFVYSSSNTFIEDGVSFYKYSSETREDYGEKQFTFSVRSIYQNE